MLRIDRSVADLLPGTWACAIAVERGRSEGPLRSYETDGEPVPDPAGLWGDGLDLDTLKDHPVVAAYRRMSWTAGVDPTKNRPAGEALARRLLSGKPLPLIHPLVDAYNLASAESFVPLSAFDLDRTRLPITLRAAKRNETFWGIGRSPEPLQEGRLVYASADGRVSGVFLWRDSEESAIRADTRHALVMAVGAQPLDADVGVHALRSAARRIHDLGWSVGPIVEADGP